MKKNNLRVLDLNDVYNAAVERRMQTIISRAMRKFFPGEIFDKSKYDVKDGKNYIEAYYHGTLLMRMTQKDRMTCVFDSPIFNED